MKQRRLIRLFAIIFILLSGLLIIGHWLSNRNTGINRHATLLSYADPRDFRIAGVSLDFPEDRVIHRLGHPHRQNVTVEPSFQNPAYNVYLTRWYYTGLEIWLLSSAAKNKPAPSKGRRVIKLIATQPGYKTFRGIGVGDSVRNVIGRYGPASLHNHSLDYYSDRGDLSFVIARSKVCRIEIDANID